MSRWKKFNDDDVPDDFVLPPGDAVRGRLLFKKHCAQCHVIEKDEPVKTGCTLLGPTLYGVYGRTAGSGPRTSLIDSSQAIKDSGIVWTDITLMRYLKNPRQFTQHPMSMNFRGLDNWQESSYRTALSCVGGLLPRECFHGYFSVPRSVLVWVYLPSSLLLFPDVDRVDLIWYIKAACDDNTEYIKDILSSRPKLRQSDSQKSAMGAGRGDQGPPGGRTSTPSGSGKL
ncbi:putative cytochrome c [Cyclospora cayetanensis]|uniref:Cytochrome c n=1 Tax=Cyclospora cayetanensis TaxID=88456 RepID=A0A1D3CUW4_9EIME|nr:putative cytochrome c [Cyclospora cayetanensis]